VLYVRLGVCTDRLRLRVHPINTTLRFRAFARCLLSSCLLLTGRSAGQQLTDQN